MYIAVYKPGRYPIVTFLFIAECYDTSITTALGRMGTNMRPNMAILMGHPEGY